MEDVNFQRSKCRRLFFAISIIIVICGAYSHAANQGVFGSSSTGSISISVTIPETVRLFADHYEVATSDNETFICIQIADRGVTDNSLHFYRIKQLGIPQSENIYMLRNTADVSSNLSNKCNQSDSLIKLESLDTYSAKTSVLMLVPE